MKTSLDSEEPLICFSDFKRLFNTVRSNLKKMAVIGAAVVFVIFAFKKPLFVAEATFRKAASTQESGLQLKDLFQGVERHLQTESGIMALLQSKTILLSCIEELGMQIEPDVSFSFFKNLWENLFLELGFSLSDIDRFVFRNVSYQEEKEFTFFIKVISEGSFELLDKNLKTLGKWRFNDRIDLPCFKAVLISPPKGVVYNKKYRFKASPCRSTLLAVSKRLRIKPFKSDRSFYTLLFSDRDRHLASDFLNELMHSYQQYLHRENEQIASAQFEYLEKRQQELLRKWDSSLQEHVAYLQKNLSQGGYLSVSQELEYLQEPKMGYTARLLETDCDLKRLKSQNLEKRNTDCDLKRLKSQNLEKRNKEKKKKEDALLFSKASEESQELLSDRSLEAQEQKVRRALVDLNREEGKFAASRSLNSFNAKSGIEEEIAHLTEEKKAALEVVEKLENPSQLPELVHDPKSLVSIWGKQIASLHVKGEDSDLCAYKDQLRLLAEENRDKIEKLRANIAIGNAESDEFAGLTLETARKLYLDYNNQRDGLQAQLKQLIYLSEQLYEPHFELSSITTILTDSVTQGLVVQAAETTVLLQDSNNRSLREQQHLKEKLRTQKSFIAQHLLQIIELTKLRLQLSEDKIASLRTTTIQLLDQEKSLLQNQLDQIHSQMGELPVKWHRENLLLFKKELGSKMIEGLTQLMETKSLDRYLYHVRSKPLDPSLPPTEASYPFLLGGALLGALGVAFLGYLFYFARSLLRGFPLSHEALKSLGFNSAGTLSLDCQGLVKYLSHHDLETLRNLVPSLIDKKVCSILGGNSPDFSLPLAELLAMYQRRVLVVHYVFDQTLSASDLPGLWQYLHGEVEICPIRQKPFADFLSSGSTSCYAVELLSHPKMASFLESIKKTYDLILFYSTTTATTAEAQALVKISDAVIVAASQTKGDLLVCKEWQQKEKGIAFVVCPTSSYILV